MERRGERDSHKTLWVVELCLPMNFSISLWRPCIPLVFLHTFDFFSCLLEAYSNDDIGFGVLQNRHRDGWKIQVKIEFPLCSQIQPPPCFFRLSVTWKCFLLYPNPIYKPHCIEQHNRDIDSKGGQENKLFFSLSHVLLWAMTAIHFVSQIIEFFFHQKACYYILDFTLEHQSDMMIDANMASIFLSLCQKEVKVERSLLLRKSLLR